MSGPYIPSHRAASLVTRHTMNRDEAQQCVTRIVRRCIGAGRIESAHARPIVCWSHAMTSPSARGSARQSHARSCMGRASTCRARLTTDGGRLLLCSSNFPVFGSDPDPQACWYFGALEHDPIGTVLSGYTSSDLYTDALTFDSVSGHGASPVLAIPEPPTCALLALGLAAIAIGKRRRRCGQPPLRTLRSPGLAVLRARRRKQPHRRSQLNRP